MKSTKQKTTDPKMMAKLCDQFLATYEKTLAELAECFKQKE